MPPLLPHLRDSPAGLSPAAGSAGPGCLSTPWGRWCAARRGGSPGPSAAHHPPPALGLRGGARSADRASALCVHKADGVAGQRRGHTCPCCTPNTPLLQILRRKKSSAVASPLRGPSEVPRVGFGGRTAPHTSPHSGAGSLPAPQSGRCASPALAIRVTRGPPPALGACGSEDREERPPVPGATQPPPAQQWLRSPYDVTPSSPRTRGRRAGPVWWATHWGRSARPLQPAPPAAP